MEFEIRYSNGRKVGGYDSYPDAIVAVLAEYPDAEIGHDGDLRDDGERTLCWASEADSIDDDGARAVAAIHPVARKNWR